MRGELDSYPDVSFIDGLMFDQFLDEMVQNYEKKYQELTGKEVKLAPAQPERLILYAAAVMLYQGLQCVDRGGKNGLLKYSKGEYLDNLAAFKRTSRNPASAARTILKFTLSKKQDFNVVIPAGTRAAVDDLFFATTEEMTIEAGQEMVEVPAVCLTDGEIGNGYGPGRITTLVDPINYVQRMENTTETSGGADEETDDALAERIYLAPSGYSTAGPEDAYRYWMQTYSAAVKDCFITSENPGEVDIYVMLQDGQIPDSEQLKEMQDYLEEGSRKPLTDKVVVKAPAVKEYEIDVTYYIEDSDRGNETVIQKQVEEACERYQEWQGEVIGRDLNPSQLTYLLVAAGASYVVVRSPVWTEITDASISKATSVNLEYGGLKDARTV